MSTMPFSKLRLADENFTNPRRSSGLEPEVIRELGLHIGHHGLMNALLVTSDGLIIAGQRRYRAIEWLLRWFVTCDDPTYREGESDSEIAEILDGVSDEEHRAIQARACQLVDAVPVRVMSGLGLGGVALADNLLREDLSSFEIAQHLDHLHAQGATGAELARLIGKSKSYVSRKLSTWRDAGAELKATWEAGTLAEDAIEQLSALPHDQQAKALAGPVARGRRGAAGRPPIEMVKDVLGEIERRPVPDGAQLAIGAEARSISYTTGVLDALRWVAGQRTSAEFAKLTEEA